MVYDPPDSEYSDSDYDDERDVDSTPRPRDWPKQQEGDERDMRGGRNQRDRRGESGLNHVRVLRSEPSTTAADVAERRRQRRSQRRSTPKSRDHNDLPVAIPRGLPLRIYVSTRIFSGLIVAALVVMLFLFLTRDVFYINVIYVGGTKYLSSGEIFQRSGIARMHLFWVDPADVEKRIEADPAIANAKVDIGWPPNGVQITITEREPALIWEQAGQRVWVDVQGKVMQLRQDIPGLMRVIVENPSPAARPGDCPLMGMDELLGPGSCIAPEIIAGALQFKALYPNVDQLVYDPAKGLGYHDGRGWVLWFGDGADITVKMLVTESIYRDVYVQQGKQLVEVDVSDPDRPYYSLAPGAR